MVKFLFVILSYIMLPGFLLSESNNVTGKNLMTMACLRPTAKYDLKVNNVRLRIRNCGGITTNSYSFINFPEDKNVSAIESIGLWVGGKDRAGNIKLSAFIDEFLGFDYFPGPLNEETASTNQEICKKWDKIFTVHKQSISEHIKNYRIAEQNNQPYDCNSIPDEVKYWPGNGNPFWEEYYGWELPDQPLAAYYDEDWDGIYNPCNGDFPKMPQNGCILHDLDDILLQLPTELVFYIMNDAGGPATLSGPAQIGMEIHVYTYSYTTNDEINNMTFSTYRCFHYATEDLYETYMGLHVVPSLGCSLDNYIGYDKTRDMAYVYNSQEVDGFGLNFCNQFPVYPGNIPTLGFDVFSTPRTQKKFKRDEDGNIIWDNNGNFIGEDLLIGEIGDFYDEANIHSFMYYEDCSVGSPNPNTCAPQRGNESQFYNYLNGTWLDETPLTKGGTGYNPGSELKIAFAFPDNPSNKNKWSMCTTNRPKASKLGFVLSIGKIYMQPGWSGNFTMGIPAAFDDKLPCPDLSALYFADDKAQALFNNCFVLPETSSTKQIEEDIVISLHPNPIQSETLNQLFISSNTELSSFRIYDIQGMEIYKEDMLTQKENRSQFIYQLMPDHLKIPKGLYIIVFEGKNKKSYSKKWMVY